MKNQMRKIILSMVALAPMLLVGTSISAATADSEVSVSFAADTAPNPPVDPDNPDTIWPTPENPGTGMAGPLSIDYISNIAFGSQTITGHIEKYEAENIKPFIQVTDKRGTAAGWVVTAEMGELKDVATGTKTINDVVLDFGNSQVTTTTGNGSTAPVASNFILTPGSAAQTVLTAAPGAGMGLWLDKWNATDLLGATNDNVTMTLNTADAYAEAYEATITWSIVVTP